MLKSIVAPTCVVRPSRLRLMAGAHAERVVVLLPVMPEAAERRLARSLTPERVAALDVVSVATATEVAPEGITKPSMGNEIYRRLGRCAINRKSAAMPVRVKERMTAPGA